VKLDKLGRSRKYVKEKSAQEFIFVFCRNCRCRRWLHYRELPDFVNEHTGHIIGVSLKDLEEDPKALQEWFRNFIKKGN